MTSSTSKIGHSLPAVYQANETLQKFLQAFEEVLIGNENQEQPGLEEAVDQLAQWFDPLSLKKTEDLEDLKGFLSWLSSWMAFSLRADIPEAQQRQFIANMIPLYQKRGTKESLKRLLSIFTTLPPKSVFVQEEWRKFKVRETSYVGRSPESRMGYIGGRPHLFMISVIFPRLQKKEDLQQIKIARGIIDLEKPAHTHYELVQRFPKMMIGEKTIIVGINTILGDLYPTIRIREQSTLGMDTFLDQLQKT
jgi:phage tail-like protein